ARLLAPETPIYHWGDVDAGGLRIAAHLEDTFETAIRLHQMDQGLALSLGSPLQSTKGLEKLETRSGEIGELTRWLRSGGAKMLEQEELDPKAPICGVRVQ
ncbi:MAG TPA: Wadjet anti-phage system protein JetD domain-containing protein, partial [Chthoniobacterales bacterium]|nr:Wadjet anti-phage system protein JetD domain-containing protein [Chthoniobacterales bacterium]